MTKEEFREGIIDSIESMKDPDAEIHTIITEGYEMVAELRSHDRVLADRFLAIVVAIENVRDYIRTRAEV